MLNISIVLYHPDWQQVNRLLEELLQAQSVRRIYLLDNSEEDTGLSCLRHQRVHYAHQQSNLGYGRAHNIAIRDSIYFHTPLHLVLNADVWISHPDLDTLCQFMQSHKEVGSLIPKVVYPNGQLQYACKLLPTPWDVFARRFLPATWNERRNRRYELGDSGYDHPMNVPYMSGCFMLMRTEAVQEARLFDERYFMYPEDIDLTRTIHRQWLTLYWPGVTIIHDHAQASYHSRRMTWVHIYNMCLYFNKWGWLFDRERRIMNRLTLESIHSS